MISSHNLEAMRRLRITQEKEIAKVTELVGSKETKQLPRKKLIELAECCMCISAAACSISAILLIVAEEQRQELQEFNGPEELNRKLPVDPSRLN